MTLLRRDINTLSDSELGDYIHALGVLRQRSQANPDDETGYSFQADLHNASPPGPCEHGSDRFFAWHRAHLHYFEKLLQEADPPRTSNVTIPYWDWIHPEQHGKFPRAFDQQGLSEPDRSNETDPLPPDTLEIVTTERQWRSFGGHPKEEHPPPGPPGNFGRLELGPHNHMHQTFIGGKMADPSTAAEDPIYFSFHCFIDLLWAEWQRRNAMPAATSPNVVLKGFEQQPKNKISDFQDTEQLNYVYGLTDQLETAFGIAAAPPTPPPAPPELVATQPLSPVFDRAALTEELRRTDNVQFELAAPPTEGRTVVLRLDGLKVPQKGSYTLRAYVHPKDVPFDDSDPEFRERFAVGYAAMWRSHTAGNGDAEAEHAHHPSAATARFDISRVLQADGPAVEHVVTLRYIPAPDARGKPEVVEEVALENAVLEVYE